MLVVDAQAGEMDTVEGAGMVSCFIPHWQLPGAMMMSDDDDEGRVTLQQKGEGNKFPYCFHYCFPVCGTYSTRYNARSPRSTCCRVQHM